MPAAVSPEPVALQGQLLQRRQKNRIHPVDLIDQQAAGTETLDQGPAIRAGGKQVGAIGAQQGTIETHQQLLAGRRAEMDQGGDVVLLQAGLTADQHRCRQGIAGGLSDRLAQPLGVAAAAHDAAPHAAEQKGSEAAQILGRG